MIAMVNSFTSRATVRGIVGAFAALAVAFALLLLPAHASAQTEDTEEFSREELQMLALSPQARAIATKLQCPVCDGQPITESNATIARQMRARVQQLVDDGATEGEILEFFEERFGPAVLREPRPEGIGLGVWLAPPIIALFGLLIVFLGLRSGRRERPQQQPARPTARPLADDDDVVAREIGRMTGKTN